MFWLWLLPAGLAGLLLFYGAYLYLGYLCSPAKLWRDEVVRAQRRAWAVIRSEEEKLQQLDARYRRHEQEARMEGLLAGLAAIPVDRLQQFPGIGPATVEKVRDAGCRNLRQLQDFRGHIPGLGRKRLADIASASRELIAQAQARLNDSTGKEAQDVAPRLKELKAQFLSDRQAAQSRQTAAQRFLRDLKPFAAAARRVSFLRYCWSRPGSLVDPRLLAERLPNLERALDQTGDGGLISTALAAPQEARPGARPSDSPGAGQTVARGTGGDRPEPRPASPDPSSASAGGNGRPSHPATPPVTERAEQLRILEIDPAAVSVDLIRRHYRLLSDRYADARARAPDAEFVRLAETRLADIRAAAAELLQSFGEELIAEPKPPAAEALRKNADLDQIMGV
jgi:hypothetical protein